MLTGREGHRHAARRALALAPGIIAADTAGLLSSRAEAPGLLRSVFGSGASGLAALPRRGPSHEVRAAAEAGATVGVMGLQGERSKGGREREGGGEGKGGGAGGGIGRCVGRCPGADCSRCLQRLVPRCETQLDDPPAPVSMDGSRLPITPRKYPPGIKRSGGGALSQSNGSPTPLPSRGLHK